MKLALWGVGDAGEHIGQPGERIDVIHFCRLQKGGDGCPRPATAIATREERIFSRYCLGSDGPFDNVGMCALKRCTVLPGENPGRQTLAPAGSTRGGSGGDEWPEALREKAPQGVNGPCGPQRE